MKKNLILLFTVILTFFYVNTAKAYEYFQIDEEAKVTFENFINYFNNNDKQIYNLIDNSNEELKNNIDKFLNEIHINYRINEITTINENHYKIETLISANGVNWNLSGFTTYYEIKLIDNEYKIINTNLFNIVGSDNVMKFILSVFAIIAGILGIFITIIIFIVKKRKRKKL